MLNRIILVFAFLILSGCDRPVYEETARYRNTYEVIGIDPPKHFYLDLKNVKTGIVHRQVYVSKHCNNWRKLKIGSKWDMFEIDYKRGDRYGTKIVTDGLCDALK